MQDWEQGWGKHQAASPRTMGQCSMRCQAGSKTGGQYCSWVVWQCLRHSWGQNQLPKLVLMAPSVDAHLGGAACLCPGQVCSPWMVPKGVIWPYTLHSPAVLPVFAVPLPFSSAGAPQDSWLSPL